VKRGSDAMPLQVVADVTHDPTGLHRNFRNG